MAMGAIVLAGLRILAVAIVMDLPTVIAKITVAPTTAVTVTNSSRATHTDMQTSTDMTWASRSTLTSTMITSTIRATAMEPSTTTLKSAVALPSVKEDRMTSIEKCSLEQALPTEPGVTYPDGAVWKENGTYWFCPCNFKPCLWMCCPKGQIFNGSMGCIESVHSGSSLEVLDDDGRKRSVLFSEFYLRYEEICPKKKLRLNPSEYKEDNYTVTVKGDLNVPFFDPPVSPSGQFCVGFIQNNSAEPVVLICMLGDSEKTDLQTAHIVYSGFMILSLPFLLATFLVYALLPKLQNLHGKIVMSHVAVLFTAYLNLVIIQLKSSSFPDWGCKLTAFIIYFAFLASFFWLNVMCLDIWWTFSGFRSMRGSVKEREHKKFIIYSLYCWGCPLIMLIICIIMDLHPGIPETYAKPGFGEVKCWFRSTAGNLIYFSGPIAVLIVCNIVLFILTATKIRQVKRGTKILKKQDSRRHNEEEENNAQRFNLYLKLFLVMGVTWIMEVISFAAGGPDEWWYVTDIANTLQGVLIFIIFVWKHRIRRLLMERFCPSRAATSHSVASSSTRMTVMRRNGSVMSSGRSSLRAQEGHPMKSLTASPSVRSDDSDVA